MSEEVLNENVAEQVESPKSLSKKERIAQHGNMGQLYIRLQRMALFGWLLFFVFILFFGLWLVVERLTPIPVLAVNESGQLLGTFEYLNPTVRTDGEVIAAGKYFLDRYLSVNSATIYNDYASALNMMNQELHKEKLQEVTDTNYLIRVEKNKTHSYNEYSDGAESPEIIARRDLYAAVRLRGYMVIQVPAVNGNVSTKLERPFDITLDMQIIPRNTLATHGIQITSIRSN